MNRNGLLLVGGGVMAAVAIGYLSLRGNHPEEAQPVASTPVPSQPKVETALSRNETADEPLPEGLEVSLKAALQENDRAHHLELLRQWAASVSIDTMEKQLALLALIKNTSLQAEANQALLTSWAGRDTPGMLKWFGKTSVPSELRQQAREILVQELGRRDLAATFSWMEKTLPDAVRTDLYAPFFRQWASTDPLGAATRLRQLTDGEAHASLWDNLLYQVASEWESKDMKRAVNWLQTLPKGQMKSLALQQAMLRWADSAPQQAASYVVQQNNPALLEAVAVKWAESDPRSAATWASQLPAGEARSAALTHLTAVWATTDPAKAAAWAQQFPEGAAREQMLGQLMTAWSASNAAEAATWLQDQPAAPSRDFAVSAFCGVITGTNPASSFQWAGTIQNQSLRTQKLESAARAWLATNPSEAKIAITQSNLPQSLKSQLLPKPTQANP